jgi:hypothetical protein
MPLSAATPPTPALSIVIAIVSDTMSDRADTAHLLGTLQALDAQEGAPSFEIIVPHHAEVDGLEEVRSRFPHAQLVCVADLRTPPTRGAREHHDELRARGLALARAPIVALLEDHGRPAPGWCAALVRAHAKDYAAVGGPIENGVDRSLNWAVFFCDFGRYQLPVPEGPAPNASDANVSYKRAHLDAIADVWSKFFHETAVNGALRARGDVIAMAPDAVVYQHRLFLTLSGALRERYVWGRSYAAGRAKVAAPSRRVVLALLSPLLPLLLLSRMALTVRRKGRCSGAFVRALPTTALLLLAWSAGEMAGYATGRVRPAVRSS